MTGDTLCFRFLMSLICSCGLLLSETGCVATGFRRPEYARVPHGDVVQAADGEELREESGRLATLKAKDNLDLEELLYLADRKNPEIAAARNQVGVATGNLWQAELYPNPRLTFEAENIPTESLSLGRSENSVAIRQPLIIGGRRKAAIRAASAARLRDIVRLDGKRRRILGAVRTAYFELLYLAESEALHLELLELASQTLATAQARFEERAAPESEKLKARVETERLKLSRRRRGYERGRVLTRLESLIGMEFSKGRISGKLPQSHHSPSFELLWQKVEKQHPQIIAAEKEIDVAVHRIEQFEAERLPDVRLRLAYGQLGETDDTFVEAGLSFPLPLFNRNQGKIMAARHQLAIARNEAQSVGNNLRNELASAYADFAAAQDQVESFKHSIIPAATKALSQVRDGYQAGRQSFLDTLDAQRTLSEARLAHIQGLRDWNIAYAKLISIVGVEE